MRRIVLVFIVLMAGFLPAVWAAEPNPIVILDTGQVRGSVEGEVESFRGIPFAAPPVGSLRWRAPQPPVPWAGIRDASAFGPACTQADDVLQSEDCLTLNVWRPAGASDKPLPVMVWIYGGALVHGRTALYPGDGLARQGVVVVSMNYRMGRLGFFAHPAMSAEAPDEPTGNFGYLDQVAALKWVQRNIAPFGGDPGNVTLFGESAGGGSVLTHLVSPLSRGLFAKAILQSPGIPSARERSLPVTPLEQAHAIAIDYARSRGISNDGPAGLAALRALPAESLVKDTSAKSELQALAAGGHLKGVAGPILDGKLLTDAPETTLRAGRQVPVPVIVGANDRDLGLGVASSKGEVFDTFGELADEARAVYDPDGALSLDELKQRVFADRTLIEPARHLADLVARSGQPAWLYRFSYVAESQRKALKGTLHGFEIPYTMNIPAGIVGPDKVTDADRRMAELASAYWTSFAKTGELNGGDRPNWPRHDPAVDRIINFTNRGVTVGPDPYRAGLDLTARAADGPPPSPRTVTLDTFVRAETDRYFAETAARAFGRFDHRRAMAPIETQDVVRMNRDTLYSSGVFDLAAGPLTVTLPDPGKRFMSMLALSQDHYATEVVYGPGRFTFTPESVGTRYVYLIVRTLADPGSPEDLRLANALQDEIKVEQASAGRFEIPRWDRESLDKVRGAITGLAPYRGESSGPMFGRKGEVDPVNHLIGTAVGWGGNPPGAAVYRGVYPAQNDGETIFELRVQDVPVDGFWSISVYDEKGFFAKNPLNAYSVNNLTAKRDADGSITIRFGGCTPSIPNCLPITRGWNYTVRLYRPGPEVLDGSWSFPEAKRIN